MTQLVGLCSSNSGKDNFALGNLEVLLWWAGPGWEAEAQPKDKGLIEPKWMAGWYDSVVKYVVGWLPVWVTFGVDETRIDLGGVKAIVEGLRGVKIGGSEWAKVVIGDFHTKLWVTSTILVSLQFLDTNE